MSEQRIPVTIVNHVAADIAASPAVVWRMILDEYVEARKFREAGGSIEALDEPGALLGGYRIRFEQDGVVVDDRICRITERDDAARRLSIAADYLLIPGGFMVYVTYHAQDAAGGTRYAIDCHTSMSVETPARGANAEIAASVAATKAHFDVALNSYLEGIRTRLEA
jgi:hypothetical protein